MKSKAENYRPNKKKLKTLNKIKKHYGKNLYKKNKNTANQKKKYTSDGVTVNE